MLQVTYHGDLQEAEVSRQTHSKHPFCQLKISALRSRDTTPGLPPPAPRPPELLAPSPSCR